MKKYLFIFFFLISCFAQAQNLSNQRARAVVLLSDTSRLDTLSIVFGSFILSDNSGKKIDTALFHLNYEKALLIIDPQLNGKKLTAKYRVFPVNFTTEYYNKDIKLIEPDEKGYYNPFEITYGEEKTSIFDFGGLTKSGSISRGISFGNNQDVVVNSSLNLQLSGKLGNDIDIIAVITDNNIPIQPDGNTQQIQDFDKVYIQLSQKKAKLIAGDFELAAPKSYFMSFYKKAQGATFTNSFLFENKNKKTTTLNLSLAAAISKGKYAKNTIAGIEGNQGPYKLKGEDNETYIIVLSGSERVYIDGMLMQRGQNEDYIIDYNTAEIIFTGKRMITKDSRIIIEFQYSDKNYARSLLFYGNEFITKNATYKLNYYSEQDMKNQPVQQQLSPEEKLLLYSIGDSLQNAFAPTFDSIAFNNNEVLYKMLDTTVNALIYDSIFVYSSNPDSAYYRLSFTNMGQGNGNYIQTQSAANGRVFTWVAPLAGVKQGTHEPIMLLITPKKKQLLTFSGDFSLNKNTKAGFETAFSNNNQNLFSQKDKKDDKGFAVNVYAKKITPLGKKDSTSWTLLSEVTNEFAEKSFSPIERYRDAEFSRDWNQINTKTKATENISALRFTASDKQKNTLGYQLKLFVNSIGYNALRHSALVGYQKKGFTINLSGSILNTDDSLSSSNYIRSKAGISKKINWLVLGFKNEQENNKLTKKINSELSAASFAYNEWQVYAENSDTTKVNFTLFYKERIDKLPTIAILKQSSTAKNIGFTLKLIKNTNNKLSISNTYRKLYIDDTLLTTQKADETILSLLEHSLKLFKGAISLTTYYETGSGYEVKKEYSYLEVAQGQGVYAWTDYNGNGVKELNEFDIAAFQDQANYIRIYIPTNLYIKVHSNQLNESLIINPSIVWNSKTGIRNFLTKFSNQTTYRIDRKDTQKNQLKAYNPFVSEVNDTNLISINSSFRNSFYFNRSSSKFGADFVYTDSKNKSLLVNGFESRTSQTYTINVRWNISKKITFSSKQLSGIKSNTSAFFSTRDFNLAYTETEPSLSWQPGKTFRLSLTYNYTEKKNDEVYGNEKCFNNKVGVEFKYTKLSSGILLVKYNLIRNIFNGATNTPVSYEMLNGLKAGKNSTWSISFQRNIAENLQMNISYEGRKSENTNMIHVGSVQLRAYF